jgi:O-antigen/teichoic acid export membrane protein
MHTARFFFFNLLGHSLPLLIALVSVPVIAHHAGVERLGALGVVWALVGYFSFLDFGLSRVVTRRVASAVEEGQLHAELGRLRRFFWSKAVPTLAVMALLLLAAGNVLPGLFPLGALGTELRQGWEWIAWCVPVTLATNWLRGVLEGVRRFARVNLLRFVFGGLNYAAPAIASLYWPTLDALIAGIVIGRIVGLLAHAWVCWRAEPGILFGSTASASSADNSAGTPAGASSAQTISVRCFFQEGGWITVSNIIGPLMVYSDRFVLGMVLPPRAVAWYVMGQEIMLRTLVIPGALAGVLFPQFAGQAGRAQYLQAAQAAQQTVYRRGLRVVAALMLPLCVLAATGAYDGLRWWLGAEFAQHAYRVVEIVAIGIFANAVSHLPLAWLQATGQADRAAKAHLLELPLYAMALYAAVRFWGIEGVAMAWALRVCLDCIVLLRLAGAARARANLAPLLAGLALIALAGALCGPEAGGSWRFAWAALCVAVAALLAWGGLLHEDDRRELWQLARHGHRLPG